jgi:hypothetical protein
MECLNDPIFDDNYLCSLGSTGKSTKPAEQAVSASFSETGQTTKYNTYLLFERNQKLVNKFNEI